MLQIETSFNKEANKISADFLNIFPWLLKIIFSGGQRLHGLFRLTKTNIENTIAFPFSASAD